MNYRAIWQAVLACVIVTAACNEREATAAPRKDSSGRRPGFMSSDLPPQGRPLVLPAGVSIAQPIPGTSIFEWEKCRNEEDEEPPVEYGSGDLVQLCLEFRNTTGKPVTVDFPPGLIMESETTDTQHGMLIQRASIVVPAKPVSYNLLYLYCLNNSRSGSAPSSRYRVGPVTEEKDFLELFDLLKNKKIPAKVKRSTNPGGIPDTAYLQQIVYTLAGDRGGLTAEQRKFIAALPNK
ncbi:hypothetical protein [Allosphingosinicella vermicomposti]|uniref:hypothetical protein n=1 Tax=Allosphingosinicella vermicomposti TaxID=614671 RepID=UPI00131A52A5|nr:hypothetical protein [Allosphingosinicella vermicomposti]